jgi:hypothetical protein
MASGDTLIILTPQHATLTGDNYPASHDTIDGGATVGEIIPCLDFDASQTEFADFPNLVMPHNYNNGGLTIDVVYSMSSDGGGSNKVRWEIGFRAIEDDAEDQDTTVHSYDTNGVSDIVPDAVGEVSIGQITFTDGADMDNVDAGDLFHLRISRDHDHADDNATGDAQLQAIHIKET